jgi:ligand-binding sensor domain-containing protein
MAVATSDRVVAIGTAGGMARVAGTVLELLTPGSKDSVTAVEVKGDTIWVGTDHGLFVALPIEPYLLQPKALEGPEYQGVVRALAWNGASLVGLTDDHLFWRAPNGRSWAVGPSLSNRLGSLRAMVPYGNGFFIAGDKGLGYARQDSVPRRIFPAPADIPGQVRQMAVTDDYLWMATSEGLIRWRLDLVAP